MITKNLLRSFAFAIALMPSFAMAEYPEKDINMLVGWAPGGFADTLARTLVPALEEHLGVKITVDNKAGASGAIAAAELAKTPADGSTMMLIIASHTTLPALGNDLPYDTLASFEPVTMLTSTPNILVTRSDFPASTLSGAISEIKAHPGDFNYASSGFGATTHITGATLVNAKDLDIVHVPYQGSANALQALLAGEVDFLLTTLFQAKDYFDSGALKALGVVGEKRLDDLPDVPTMSEAGVEGVMGDTWTGILVPAGTPKDIVSRLRDSYIAILQKPEIADVLASRGQLIVGSTPEEFGARMNSEVTAYGGLKDAGLLVKDQ